MTNIHDNPKGFNEATLQVIDLLGGDRRTGKCFCPCHDDGENPSLQVGSGDKVPVVIHCFGRNSREHDQEVLDYLRAEGIMPTSNALVREQSSEQAEQARSPEDRRLFAAKIWRGLRDSGEEFRPLLASYLNGRGIKEVPTTARATMPPEYLACEDSEQVVSHDPGIVLPVRDEKGEFQGLHVIWLNPAMTAKCDTGLQRQSYGLIKGNLVQLTGMDWDHPPDTLLIGEGVETTLAAMQVTELPGIATAGAGMMQHLNPPRCRQYIILADNGEAGQQAASVLASMLLSKYPDCAVQTATPQRPEGGKKGYDWNDALVDAGTNNASTAEMRRAILEAPPFVATKDQTQAALIDALAKIDDPIAFDRRCKQAKEDMGGVSLGAIKKAVSKRRNEWSKAAAAAPAKLDIDKLAESARENIESKDVLALFADEIGRLIVGEERNAKLLYLVATSRLFPKPMHAAIKGPSSGGKSEIRKRVLEFMPPEDVISFTSISDKALFYMPDDLAHKILSMGEAITGKEVEFQDYLLRELMSEGKLRYPVVQKVDGELRTITIEKNGPVAFMVTTTRNKLNPENETRMLSLEVNDSEEQTRAVLGKVAEVEGLNRKSSSADPPRWHDHQRWLAAGECEVVVPFAETLSQLIKVTRSVRLRRDFTQLLVAIKAHALVHRAHRERDGSGRIVAEIQDYVVVRGLMADMLATASELKLRQAIAETVQAVERVTARSNDPEASATVREIASELQLDKSSTSRRLKAAEEAGLVVNLETGKGRPARIRVTGEKSGSDAELLPTTKQLREAYEAERQEREAA